MYSFTTAENLQLIHNWIDLKSIVSMYISNIINNVIVKKMFNTNVESSEVWLQNFQQLHNKSNNFPQLEADVRCSTSLCAALWLGGSLGDGQMLFYFF